MEFRNKKVSCMKKVNVCQTCGDKGKLKHLEFCKRCHVLAQHSYCTNSLTRESDVKVSWTFKECSPKILPSRTSERIRKADKMKLNRIKNIRKMIDFRRVHSQIDTDLLPKVKRPLDDDLCLQDEETNIESLSFQSLVNEKLRKPKRRLLLLHDKGNSDEECKFGKDSVINPSQTLVASPTPPSAFAAAVAVSQKLRFSEIEEYIHAQPMIDSIWRGFFWIKDVANRTLVALAAHLSTKACSKVWDAANLLPQHLNIEILPKSDVWPKKFQITPPTDENIALYFFPKYERDERIFDCLIDMMIMQDRALKAVINNVELLIFSSCELPLEHWRFSRNYYLWGVFRSANTPVNDSNMSFMLSNLTKNASMQTESDLCKNNRLEGWSQPIFQAKACSSCVAHSRDSVPYVM